MNVVEENTFNLKQATTVSLNDKSELTIENALTKQSQIRDDQQLEETTNIEENLTIKETNNTSLSIGKELTLGNDTMTVIHFDINEDNCNEGSNVEQNVDDSATTVTPAQEHDDSQSSNKQSFFKFNINII
ncbi:uncharacterized protein LOC127289481 [Leptopilina boulardi]|uniref:uncharacterized protein LOC127289481 n=1 Tax=Leptopilina boulardi TaxID=63433 RepID=UPI0021F55B95|nr:uncharacterized protein LOC127289481 [Leptopilina boulardi]